MVWEYFIVAAKKVWLLNDLDDFSAFFLRKYIVTGVGLR